MKFIENPFFMLDVSIYADKNTISESVDELCFDYPEKEDGFEEAHSILINPQKRISAEIRWFPGVEKEQEKEIVKDIQQKVSYQSVYQNDLVRLNYLIYSLTYQTDENLISNLIEIDKLYSNISLFDVMGYINAARGKSGFPMIQNVEMLQLDWNEKKSDIREIIQDFTKKMRREKYTRLANEIITTINGKEDYGSIIEDFFTNYQMDMNPFFIDEKEKIKKLVESIKTKGSESDLKQLEIEIRLTAPVLKPINMMYISMGLTNYGETSEIYFPVRDLSLYMYNEKNDVASSFKLVDILKSTFGYIPEVKETLENDYAFLKEKMGSPIFCEANKALDDIISTMNKELFYEEGHETDILRFYRNDFLNCYKKIINEFMNRSGYSNDELSRLNESVAIIYKGMGMSITWANEFEIAYDLIHQALGYARRTNNRELIKKLEEQELSLKNDVDRIRSEPTNTNDNSYSAQNRDDNSGCGGCFLMILLGGIGAAIAGPVGFFIGAWIGSKISD